MPENASIVFSFAGLPGGSDYCFTGYNRFALDIAANMSGFVPGAYNFYNYGPTEPAVDDRDKPWFNTNDGQWYFYDSGNWVRPHSVPPGTAARILWTGSESDLWAYDGGDGTNPTTNPPTATTGAMWQIDPDYAGRYLAVVGSMPGGSATVISPSVNGGSDQITISEANLAPHRHGPGGTGKILTVDPHEGDNAAALQYVPGGGDSAEVTTNWTALAGGTSGAATPVNIVPPFRGIYLAKRTTRTMILA